MQELNKATKGTPEYEEWLRKYREKRGLKAKPSELKRMLSVDAEKAVENENTIFTDETRKILQKRNEPQQTLKSTSVNITADQIKLNKEASKSFDDAKVDPTLLKAEKSPVFANLFGHYPVEPISYKDRLVTTPVEQIDVALAEELDEIPDSVWESDEYVATEKVDGVRATVICTPEATRITARRQKGVTKPSTDYTNNLPHLRDIGLYAILGDTVLDSEAAASNPVEVKPGEMGDRLSSVMSIVGIEKDLNQCVERMNKFGRVLLFCFDIQRFEGKDLRNLPYSERMQYLNIAMDRISKVTSDIKKVAMQKEGESKKEFFNRIVSTDGEGLVLANKNASYKAFDRKARIKAKRTLEYTLQVMDVLEGIGRNKGKAGSFIMGANINGELIPVSQLNVGSDELRENAWKNKNDYIGKFVEVKAMQWSPKGSLRHARWKTPGIFRDEKTEPDDLTEIRTAILSKRIKK